MKRAQYANNYSNQIGTVGYYINKHANPNENRTSDLSRCTSISSLVDFLNMISREAENDGHKFEGEILKRFEDLMKKVKSSYSFSRAWYAVFNMGAAGDGDRVIRTNFSNY